MSDRNPFGGSNPHSAYVPMTDVERESIQRLIESRDLRLVIHGWGFVDHPALTLGEGRVSVVIDITFHDPEIPIPVSVLELELQTQAGMTLFRKAMVCEQNGLPLLVGKDFHLIAVWDIQIHHIDPAVVKMLNGKMGALGLTSKRLDKDTREPTLFGNMKIVNPVHREILHLMDKGETLVRSLDAEEIAKKVNPV